MQTHNKVEPFASKNGTLAGKVHPPPYYSPSAPPASPPTPVPPQSSPSSSANSHENGIKTPQTFLLYPTLPSSEMSEFACPPATDDFQNQGTFQPVISQNGHPVTKVPYVSGSSMIDGGIYTVQTLANQACRSLANTERQLMNLQLVQQPLVTPYKQRVVCPYCKIPVTTFTTSRIGMLSHLSAITACVSTCCLCTCIPYFFNRLKDVEHYCPHCSRLIAYYRRLGHI